jgi:hypothetical protein
MLVFSACYNESRRKGKKMDEQNRGVALAIKTDSVVWWPVSTH